MTATAVREAPVVSVKGIVTGTSITVRRGSGFLLLLHLFVFCFEFADTCFFVCCGIENGRDDQAT